MDVKRLDHNYWEVTDDTQLWRVSYTDDADIFPPDRWLIVNAKTGRSLDRWGPTGNRLVDAVVVQTLNGLDNL